MLPTKENTTIKILQHNVLTWMHPRRRELRKYYTDENPDIILLNSTGKRQSDQVRIPGYRTFEKNHLNKHNAGVVVAVKSP